MATKTREATDEQGDVPGADADRPAEVPARGWGQILRRAWKESKADQVPLLGAGVAFYAFMSLFPAMIALILVYGLVADPAQIADQVKSATGALPADAQQLITTQLQSMASGRSHLGVGLIVALALALWSASSGMGNLMTAVNTAYDEDEKRGFVKRKGLALLMTIGAIVFMLVVIVLVAVVPAVLSSAVSSPPLSLAISLLRYVILVLIVSGALAIVYRVSPSRDAPQMRWVSIGADRRHGAVVGGVDRFLPLRHLLRLLCEDLRRARERRRPAPVAVDHVLRRAARRGDQRRVRTADGGGHHDRAARADGHPRSGEGGLARRIAGFAAGLRG